MKFLTLTMIALFSMGVMAGDHKDHMGHKEWDKRWDKMSFEDAKKMMQEKFDKKSAMIEESRTCINAAKDKNALKSCKQDMHEEKRAMKDEMKDKYLKQSQEE